MPLLARRIQEEKLLSIGLFMGFINVRNNLSDGFHFVLFIKTLRGDYYIYILVQMFVSSIAWSIWVPYAATGIAVFMVLGPPSVSTFLIPSINHINFNRWVSNKFQICL